MPISVGEVNATLRFNVLTEKLAEAQANLKALQEQFRATGGAAAESAATTQAALSDTAATISLIQSQMVAARAATQNMASESINAINRETDAMYGLKGAVIPVAVEVGKLGAAGKSSTAGLDSLSQVAGVDAVTGLTKFKTSAKDASEAAEKIPRPVREAATEMDNLDRLATRMAERMAIAFTIREIFGFVENLYNAAEAMEALHERTGVSVETLQVWERVGRNANLSAETMGKAVDFLQKTLARVTPETADALERIGLSFGKIASLSPDQRLIEVVTRIGELPTQLQRDAESLKLVGTDAIEPLTKNFDSLAKAVKAGGLPDPQQIELLATGARGWKDLKDAVSDYATMGLGATIKMIDHEFSPAMALLSGGTAAYGERLREIAIDLGELIPKVQEFSAAVIRPEASHGPSGPAGSDFLMPSHLVHKGGAEAADEWGEAFVQELEKKITEISPQLSDRLSRLENIGQLTMQTASDAGASPDKFREYVKQRKDLHEILVQEEIDLKNADVQTMTLYTSNVKLLQTKTQEAQLNYGARAQIDLLKAEDEAEHKLSEEAFLQLTSYKDKTRVLKDYAQIHETLTKQILALEKEVTKERNAQVLAEFEAKNKLMALYGLTPQGGNIDKSAFTEFVENISKLRRENPGQDTTQREQLIIKEFLDAEKAAADAAVGLGTSLAKATDAVRIGTTTFTEAFGIASHMLTFSLSAAWSDPTARLNGTVPQPRASGGPVDAGMPYIVGDGGGPELFIPGRNGTIMPYGSGGGAPVIHLNVAGVWDPATVRVMADMIGTAMMKRSGRQFGSA